MNRPQAFGQNSAAWPKVWISIALGVGTCTLIPWVAMAFQPEDVEALESPLLLAIVHEIESGPRCLYGPYEGRNPLVLIHAPLYYRLAGVMGWLFFKVGSPPVMSALVAGRLLSTLGFLTTLLAAYRLARLGSMPVTAGGWAALLVAATPIYGGIPFEVRPDMLGIAFQMTGILLVLAAIANVPVRESKLNAAAVCFAAAVCTKQQFLVAPLVSVVLMVEARASGRLGVTAIARFRGHRVLPDRALLRRGGMGHRRADVEVCVHRRPKCGPGSPGGLVVRDQPSARGRLEMRGPDPAAGGRRPGHRVGPVRARATGVRHRGNQPDRGRRGSRRPPVFHRTNRDSAHCS